MDVLITNLGSHSPDDNVFIPGPNIDLPAGASKTWSDVTVADLDGSPLAQMVLDGTVSVDISPSGSDAAVALHGTLHVAGLAKYTVANLPLGYEGRMAFASNGRKNGEGGGAGTGVPVYFSNGAWRTFPADAAVTV